MVLHMKALITGASSGIGRDMARILSGMGYDLILVARRSDRLEELRRELKTDAELITADLSLESECFRLYEQVADERVDVLINSAGFGLFGPFAETDLNRELRMIDTNVRAVHILTKLFLRGMKARDSGYILNVASAAAFFPGPLLSSYYASKAYVLRLTQAIGEELRREGSHVRVSALCPGPVRTEFDLVAQVKFSVRGMNSRDVAEYALRQMFRGKTVIVPGRLMKTARFFSRFASDRLVLKAAYRMQKRKDK